MIAVAKGRHLRVSPFKLRQVIDLVRGKNVLESNAILLHLNKGSTRSVAKILSSAVASAKQKGVTEEQLFISKIYADGGPALKRWRAAAFGRATKILKKTSHLTIELDLITK